MTLKEARDGAWEALAHAPVRRFMLGRDRCDRLVRLAIETAMPSEYIAAGADSDYGTSMRQAICERVAVRFEERCSSVFVSMILSWAISAIVQYLIRRWWNS